MLQTEFFEGADSVGDANGLKHEFAEKSKTEVEQADPYEVGASDGCKCMEVGIS